MDAEDQQTERFPFTVLFGFGGIFVMMVSMLLASWLMGRTGDAFTFFLTFGFAFIVGMIAVAVIIAVAAAIWAIRRSRRWEAPI